MRAYDVVFLIAALAVIYKLKPSVLQPVLWKTPNPLPTLTGALAPNSVLLHARFLPGDFSGPESLAFDLENGDVFAGVSDGSVLRFSATGEEQERIFFVGGHLAKDSKSAAQLFDHCHTEAVAHRLAWNSTGEQQCGRPLGLRWRQV
jgi:hypothetical protein